MNARFYLVTLGFHASPITKQEQIQFRIYFRTKVFKTIYNISFCNRNNDDNNNNNNDNNNN